MGRNEVSDLAYWFVKNVIGREWTQADYGGTHMAHAKRLIKEMKYNPADIRACIMAIVDGTFEFEGIAPNLEFRYLITILKGEPPYIEQFLAVPNPPPVYEIEVYDHWVRMHGQKAVEDGVWDGVYLPINQPYRLTEYEIAYILGEHYAQLSLERVGKLCLTSPILLPKEPPG